LTEFWRARWLCDTPRLRRWGHAADTVSHLGVLTLLIVRFSGDGRTPMHFCLSHL